MPTLAPRALWGAMNAPGPRHHEQHSEGNAPRIQLSDEGEPPLYWHQPPPVRIGALAIPAKVLVSAHVSVLLSAAVQAGGSATATVVGGGWWVVRIKGSPSRGPTWLEPDGGGGEGAASVGSSSPSTATTVGCSSPCTSLEPDGESGEGAAWSPSAASVGSSSPSTATVGCCSPWTVSVDPLPALGSVSVYTLLALWSIRSSQLDEHTALN
eukprot:CAMPEP_0118929042 /NCGR_PEP_ID=MMETSP1169-20130426/6156_1 /TAXON_ID=36882 /ORGANISM="Pyramimonas obovata, Strain CCMP722" /LENGTH=210 /DNA_ID=CAMNT_0006871159 /DNA_START=163 /DNA_END=796 /DNA_ORIENTATION=+